jgi:hypothetical protein
MENKRCLYFSGGVCGFPWEELKSEDNPYGFYGEGCELNINNSCPHEKIVEWIPCPICKGNIPERYSCKTCLGEGKVPNV